MRAISPVIETNTQFPDFLVRTIKRAKHQPIWVPGVNFPDDPMDIYEQMKPFGYGCPTQHRARTSDPDIQAHSSHSLLHIFLITC